MRKKKTINEVIEQRYVDAHVMPAKPVYIPSSSTLLDLGCSGTIEGAFKTGSVINIIGDSSAGKSLLCLSTLASVCSLPQFDDYELTHDDTEYRSNWDIRKMFGSKLHSRLKPPGGHDKTGFPKNSNKIEEFEYYVHDRLKKCKPFIYVLDSLDRLMSDQDESKLKERLNAIEKDVESKGSYDMAVQKFLSRFFKTVMTEITRSNSLLCIVSQTRDNINPGYGEPKNYRAGGRALKFYCNHEIWLARAGQIKNSTYKIKVGNHVVGKITKNSITGKERQIGFDILDGHGIDDVGSCIDYIMEHGHWEKDKLTIIAKELGLQGTRESLINQIIEKKKIRQLKVITKMVWDKVESAIKIKRPSRFE